MTTYRLPDALGGGEVESLAAPVVVDGTPVRTQDGDVILVPMSLLTEVKPPLPPEPSEPRTLIWTGFKDGRGTSWEKSNSGWWYAMGSEGRFTWAEVCAYGTPVRLIPDPFAEPIVVPWNYKDGTTAVDATLVRVGIDGCRDGEASVRLVRDGHVIVAYVPARLFARALWAAADAVKARAAAS